MRFNAPPGWPVPPSGWVPAAGWRPDPSWPPAPPGWVWWIPDDAAPLLPPPTTHGQTSAQAAPAEHPSSRLDDYLLAAARWGQQRTKQRRTDQLPAVTPTGQGAGKWFALAHSVATYAPVHAAAPGADQILNVVQALYEVEDEQSRMLHTIDTNVRLLKEGAFRSGRLLVSEATRVGPTDPEYHRLLEKARDKFYEAQPLASSVQDRAVVEMNLALISLPLGRAQDAHYWLEQSYQSAQVVIEALTKQSANIKVLKTKWATTTLSVYYPAGLLVVPMKLKRVWGAERARTALIEFLPFVNSLAASLNTLAGEQHIPLLELTSAPGGELTLQEVESTGG